MEQKRNKLWREQQCKRVFKARMIYYASFEHDVIDDEGNLIHSPHWFELAKLRCWKSERSDRSRIGVIPR